MGRMKSKQLANVLFKVLGFSVCLYAIPSCVSGVILELMRPPASGADIEALRMLAYPIGAGIQFVIGAAIIATSRTISGWLFKDDDE